MQHHPVLDKEGKPIGVYTYNGSVANRSLELLGKHVGMTLAGPGMTLNVYNVNQWITFQNAVVEAAS